MLELTILLVAGLTLAALFVAWAASLSFAKLEVPPTQVRELLNLVPLPGIGYDEVEQLFDAGDYAYLKRLGLHEVAQQFERDRRRAALRWLKLLGEDFSRLQRFRRLLLACGTGSNSRGEWALFLNSASFRLAHGFLTVWVYLFGLYATPRAHLALVSFARGILARVACALARLSPDQLARLEREWGLRGTA